MVLVCMSLIICCWVAGSSNSKALYALMSQEILGVGRGHNVLMSSLPLILLLLEPMEAFRVLFSSNSYKLEFHISWFRGCPLMRSFTFELLYYLIYLVC